MTTVLAGFVTGLSLIVAIGAQNAYVLRQGLQRRHVGLVVAICAVSDLVLIIAGVAGVGAVVQRNNTLLTILTWAGAAYLVWFGCRSLLSARRPTAIVADGDSAPATGTTRRVTRNSMRTVAVTTMALTWLNPHVYLDTVLMLGNIANARGPVDRWWFAVGACIASLVWFSALGFASRYAARWLGKPAVWRVLDVLIGLTMFAIAVILLLG